MNGVQKNKGTLKFKVAPINTGNYVNDTGPAAGEWKAISQLTNSAANLAGNYPSSKSYTVVAEFTDLFTQQALSASATVSTEAVIHAYDKEGRLGVGKVPENGRYGSVDIAGDYYSGGKMIQQYPIITRTVPLVTESHNGMLRGMYKVPNLDGEAVSTLTTLQVKAVTGDSFSTTGSILGKWFRYLQQFPPDAHL